MSSSSNARRDSPKTPGGISKSLLTPIRRLGLSRKWKNPGSSTFVSPLSCDNSPKTEFAIAKKHTNKDSAQPTQDNIKKENIPCAIENDTIRDCDQVDLANISFDTQKGAIESNNVTEQVPSESNKVNALVGTTKNYDLKPTAKENSPNNLTKECIVLIQKKINKNALTKEKIPESNEKKPRMPEKNKLIPVSQALFDSDSDDAPLGNITVKKCNEKLPIERKKRPRFLPTEDDDDFTVKVLPKVKKLEDKNTSTGDLKRNKKTLRSCKIPILMQPVIHVTSSQSSTSFDDDDDSEFDRKKTIFIRKITDKVTKPRKAKSTGSVTQKDVEKLKAMIKKKKNMLSVKAISNTDELRALINKWKRGCQDILTELMDLMKEKLFDKQFIDYSEILQMLKIPSGLVGYDSENNCFVSPDDDAVIILSKF